MSQMSQSIGNLHLINQWPFFSTTPSPFTHLTSLSQFSQKIKSREFTLEQFKEWKKELKVFIQSHPISHDELDAFLKEVITWGTAYDPRAFFNTLAEIVDTNKLNELAHYKTRNSHLNFRSVRELAQQMVEDYPLESSASFKDRLYIEWQKFRPLVLYFIPNVLNIFFEVFNFLDSHKKFTSLWEKHLLLEVLYKFILIPFTLIHILNPILVAPTKVYLVATLILFGTGLLAAAYHRWFKPIPADIVNCKNLEKQVELGIIKPKIGQSATLEKIIQAMMSGSNILIIGKSGEGKTALVHQLVQLKKEGKLPKNLSELRAFSLNCGDLMGHGSFGHAEMINQTKEKIEGFEKKLLMFFDDIDALANNPSCMHSFKQCFMNEDEHNPLFIASTTIKGLQKIQELDTDGSFMQRVVPIVLESASDDQCELVLNEFIKQHAQELPITEKGIKKILELSKSDQYLPEIGRLAKMRNIMRATIGRCEWAYSSQYIPKKLAKLKEDYNTLASKPFFRSIFHNTDLLQQRREIRHNIHQLENELTEQKKQVVKIKHFIQRRKIFSNQHVLLTHRLAKEPTLKVSEHDQKLYFLYQLYGEEVFENVIKESIDQIRDKSDIQIDERLVTEVFNALKNEQNRITEFRPIIRGTS